MGSGMKFDEVSMLKKKMLLLSSENNGYQQSGDIKKSHSGIISAANVAGLPISADEKRAGIKSAF